jgi:hypothetical protein
MELGVGSRVRGVLSWELEERWEPIFKRTSLTSSSDVTLDGPLRVPRRLSPRPERPPRLPHRRDTGLGRWLDSMCMEH